MSFSFLQDCKEAFDRNCWKRASSSSIQPQWWPRNDCPGDYDPCLQSRTRHWKGWWNHQKPSGSQEAASDHMFSFEQVTYLMWLFLLCRKELEWRWSWSKMGPKTQVQTSLFEFQANPLKFRWAVTSFILFFPAAWACLIYFLFVEELDLHFSFWAS